MSVLPRLIKVRFVPDQLEKIKLNIFWKQLRLITVIEEISFFLICSVMHK